MVSSAVPNVLIDEPLAALRLGSDASEECAAISVDEAAMRETSAPVSMRKSLPEMPSLTTSRVHELDRAATVSSFGRFPDANHRVSRTSWLEHRTGNDRSKACAACQWNVGLHQQLLHLHGKTGL